MLTQHFPSLSLLALALLLIMQPTFGSGVRSGGQEDENPLKKRRLEQSENIFWDVPSPVGSPRLDPEVEALLKDHDEVVKLARASGRRRGKLQN